MNRLWFENKVNAERIIKRKERIVNEVWHSELWKPKHYFSKNKIHCSCPICACKTNPRKARYFHYGYKHSDLLKLDKCDYFEEYEELKSQIVRREFR